MRNYMATVETNLLVTALTEYRGAFICVLRWVVEQRFSRTRLLETAEPPDLGLACVIAIPAIVTARDLRDLLSSLIDELEQREVPSANVCMALLDPDDEPYTL